MFRLYSRLIFIFILFWTQFCIADGMIINSGNTCAQGADSSDLCAGGTTGVNLAGSDARGFCFTKSGTETVWGIDVYLWANDGVGDSITLRIGTSSDLSTYLAESSSTNITNTSGQFVTIDFEQCLELTNATVYCVGMIETGTVLMGRSASNVCGSDSNDAYTYASGSGGWNMINSDTTYDIQWTLILDD